MTFNAYYYSFEPTGVPEIDAILEAVARAGKAYHNTADWAGGMEAGPSEAEKIQAAADAAAESWREREAP